MRTSELARQLKPYIIPWMREIGTAGGLSTGGGGGGTLDSHVLATASALGPYHTVSGLTAGHVLRAASPTTAAFAQLGHGDLNGVTPDQHHAQATAGNGISLSGQQISIASTAAGAGLTYTTGVLAVGAGLGLTVNADDVALTTPGTLTVNTTNVASGNHTHAVTASSAPGAAASLLKTDASGYVTVVRAVATGQVRTPEIDTASGDLALAPATGITGLSNLQASGYVRTPTLTAAADLTLSPTGDVILTPGSGAWVQLTDGKSLRTATFNSGFAGNGFRIDQGVSEAARTTLEVDNVWVRGRMHVYEMLIHQIRATNGSLFVSSTGKVTAVSGAGPYTMTTDPAHGFAVGDLLRAQRWDAASSTMYQSNLTVTAVADTTHFTATLSSGDAPAVGFEYVRLGSASDANRRGGVHLTADDSGAPFIDVFDGVNSFATWGTAGVIKTRLGKLDGLGLSGGFSNEYGLFAGNGSTDADAYLRLSNSTNRLNNLSLEWWAGGSKLISITPDGGVDIRGAALESSARAYTFSSPTTTFAGLYATQTANANWLGLRLIGNLGDTASDLLFSVTNSNNETSTTLTLEAVDFTETARIKLTAESVGTDASLIELTADATTISGTLAVTGTTTLGTVANMAEVLRINAERAWSFGAFGAGGTTEVHLYPVVDSKYFRITDQANTVNVFSVFAAATGSTVAIIAPLTVTGAGSISGNLTVGGTLTSTGAITTDGSVTVDGGTAGLGQLAAATLQLGNGRTVAGSSFLDFVTEASGGGLYTDYGLRLIRSSTGTPNGNSQILHKGTGILQVVSVEAGSIELATANATRVTIDSTGLVGVNITPTSRFHVGGNARASGFYADAENGGIAGTTGLSNGTNVAANSTGVGTIKMKGATSRDSTGFIKVYIGTTIYWVPVFAVVTG